MSDNPSALVLTAHADDCEFFAGGLVAKLVDEGYDVVEVIATDNSRGSFELDRRSLVRQSRDEEARRAAEVLGKRDVVFLGHPDGYLDEIPKNELRELYIEHIRELQPAVLLTFDPFAPFEEHPDHRHVATAAHEAVSFAHLPLYCPEQLDRGLLTHLVPERYYFAKAPVHANTVIDITPHIDRKLEALCAHESQMRMMVEELRRSFQATGKHPELLEALDPEHFRPPLELLIRAWARSVGKKAGYEYGEEFRYEYPGEIVDRLG